MRYFQTLLNTEGQQLNRFDQATKTLMGSQYDIQRSVLGAVGMISLLSGAVALTSNAKGLDMLHKMSQNVFIL